jgi:RsiW-degrading membrane proteinase PrsW (M82 family)
LWGKAGVLKFPHGVALHAIQMLPIVAWLAHILKLPNAVRIVQGALASQLFFLCYAIWQTSQGRERFDWDTIGLCILGVSILPAVYAGLAIAIGCLRTLRATS